MVLHMAFRFQTQGIFNLNHGRRLALIGIYILLDIGEDGQAYTLACCRCIPAHNPLLTASSMHSHSSSSESPHSWHRGNTPSSPLIFVPWLWQIRQLRWQWPQPL